MDKIICRTISLDKLHPCVLNVGHTGTTANLPSIHSRSYTRTPERFAYDYEIEFVTEDGGVIFIDGTEYNLLKGDLIFRRPGQRCNSIPPYSCWYLFLDLLGNSGKHLDNYTATKTLKFQEYILNPFLDKIPASMKISNRSRLTEIFTQINLLARSKSDLSVISLKINILELLYIIGREADKLNTVQAGSGNNPAVVDAIDYINKNYAGKITLGKISNTANYSPTYFHRLFKKTTGKTLADYLIQVRLDRVCYLLLHSNLTCAEIATACGLNSSSYLSYIFRKHISISPNEYRARYLHM